MFQEILYSIFKLMRNGLINPVLKLVFEGVPNISIDVANNDESSST